MINLFLTCLQRKPSVPSFKTPTTTTTTTATTPLPAPNTVPRATKRVKFESTAPLPDNSQIAFATPQPVSKSDRTQNAKMQGTNRDKKHTDSNKNNGHLPSSKNINTTPNKDTTINKTPTKNKTMPNKNTSPNNNKRKHEDTESDTSENANNAPTKPRMFFSILLHLFALVFNAIAYVGYVLAFTGFKKGDETAVQSDLQEKAKALQMTCHADDGLDSSVTHVVY